MNTFDPIKEVTDDNLYTPDPVGEWSLEKWKLMGDYCNIFTSAMKYKWDDLVYIDLYASAGYGEVRNKGGIHYSSPLIALSTPHNFTQYIFCEKNIKCLNALKKRVRRDYPMQNVEYFEGDCNVQIDSIISAIPSYSRNKKVLTFCFVDPFKVSNFKFDTIRKLGDYIVDFLILLPFHMDINRNSRLYSDHNSSVLTNFLGTDEWKNRIKDREKNGIKVVKCISNMFDEQMMKLGYIKPEHKFQVKSSKQNLPLYHLAFYSKNETGNKFYKEVKKLARPQLSLGI